MFTGDLPSSEVQRYMRGIRQVAAVVDQDSRAVLRGEVGVVLKTWAGRTKVATVAQADRRTRLRVIRDLGYTKGSERGDVTVNAGFRPAPFGRVWIRVRPGGGSNQWILAKGAGFSNPSGKATFTLFGRKLYNGGDPDRSTSFQWADSVRLAQEQVEQRLATALEAGRRAIGLARQSIVQIADSLGLRLEDVPGGGNLSPAGIAKARGARASNGRDYANGVGQLIETAQTALYTLINGLPYALPLNMDRTLAGVLVGRARYYQRNLAEGVFLSAARTARAYPFLNVSRN